MSSCWLADLKPNQSIRHVMFCDHLFQINLIKVPCGIIPLLKPSSGVNVDMFYGRHAPFPVNVCYGCCLLCFSLVSTANSQSFWYKKRLLLLPPRCFANVYADKNVVLFWQFCSWHMHLKNELKIWIDWFEEAVAVIRSFHWFLLRLSSKEFDDIILCTTQCSN